MFLDWDTVLVCSVCKLCISEAGEALPWTFLGVTGCMRGQREIYINFFLTEYPPYWNSLNFSAAVVLALVIYTDLKLKSCIDEAHRCERDGKKYKSTGAWRVLVFE